MPAALSAGRRPWSVQSLVVSGLLLHLNQDQQGIERAALQAFTLDDDPVIEFGCDT
jgi:hypothetical protein